MAVIIDGKELAKKIRSNLKIECEELKKKNINSKLAVIMVGDDPASKVYVRNKSRACEDVGIEYEEYLLDANITQKELIELIEKLNNDKTINGILLQSPIPSNLDINEAFRTISPEKDVDGFNPVNVGKLVLNQDTFVSCTPYGIMKMFEEYNIDLTGKDVVILGRSNIVGKPLIHCCLNKNATVTSCHSKTQSLTQKAREADILISAIGKANFVTVDMVKENAVVIDVGINRLDNGKITGDVDFENVKEKASYITPVPGGVGPMTIAMLMNNVIKATKRHKIKLEEKDILDDLKDLIEKSKKSKVLIITNTVNKAIDIFLELQELKVENINLLHSRFIYNDRSAKEFKIKKFSENRKENGIWITTQIVEASLDIDFDYLYTEMSTLDSLFQRLGRCYRSREYDGQDANVHIYIENMSGIKYIYDEEINKISIDLLKKYDGMMLDENTKVNLVDKLYSEDMLKNSKFLKRFKSGINILDNIIDYQTGKKEAQKLLRNIENVNIIPKQIYEENLKLFEYYAKEVNYKERNRIKREIDKLTISISQSQQRKLLDRLTKNPYIKELLIADLKYDDNIGLLLKKDEEYEENEKFLWGDL